MLEALGTAIALGLTFFTGYGLGKRAGRKMVFRHVEREPFVFDDITEREK